jgi:hypothetical protein
MAEISPCGGRAVAVARLGRRRLLLLGSFCAVFMVEIHLINEWNHQFIADACHREQGQIERLGVTGGQVRVRSSERGSLTTVPLTAVPLLKSPLSSESRQRRPRRRPSLSGCPTGAHRAIGDPRVVLAADRRTARRRPVPGGGAPVTLTFSRKVGRSGAGGGHMGEHCGHYVQNRRMAPTDRYSDQQRRMRDSDGARCSRQGAITVTVRAKASRRRNCS